MDQKNVVVHRRTPILLESRSTCVAIKARQSGPDHFISVRARADSALSNHCGATCIHQTAVVALDLEVVRYEAPPEWLSWILAPWSKRLTARAHLID
jgi:hypothetical protein